MPKTFKEFGLKFEFDENCLTCSDGSCHNIVTSKHDGKEYNVHIATDREGSFYSISAFEQANTSSDDDISQTFYDEEEAVKFVCATFEWFKCF